MLRKCFMPTIMILTATSAVLLITMPRFARAGCVGDCNGDGAVTVNECVDMVSVALGNTVFSSCPAGDVNDDGAITIDEIVGAVAAVLSGCAVTPTVVASLPPPTASATALPSDSATPTQTGTATAIPTARATATPTDTASPSSTATPTVTPTPHPQSIARQWDEEILGAIRIDLPRPPVHARNLFHLSVAMWDAWAAYAPTALGYLTTEKHTSTNVETDRAEAISYAAYGVLSERYSSTLSVGAATSLASFTARMNALGYDPSVSTTTGDTPAAIGNRIAQAVIAYGLSDGSNEAQNHKDPTYVPVNPPLIVALPGTTMNDPNSWQPLALTHQVTQNGIPIPGNVQVYVGSQWGSVLPFAANLGALLPNPPPRLHDPATDQEFKQAAVEVIRASSNLTPDDGGTLDISPATFGNNPLGTNDGGGYDLNPATGQPYTPEVVKRGDFRRVIAEFWADGPSSETPPGHWNVLANQVSDHPLTEKRIGGTGPSVDDLEWDVKLYFAINAAAHDAAYGCWGTKRMENSTRPISMIRYMGELGQSSEPTGPSYHPDGLPLVPGLIEVITPESSAPGQRHAALAAYAGEIAVYAWPGGPADPASQHSRVQWIRAKEWVPYQKDTFVTPAFAAYTSGHSTFSRAGAEVLAHFTGSPYFPGGLGEFLAPANAFLKFERGPSTDIRLQWATYYDAADQAGQSRIWGGIHILADDFNGRVMGSIIGDDAYGKARTYWEPGAANTVTPGATWTSSATASVTPTTTQTPNHTFSTTSTATRTAGVSRTPTPTPFPAAQVHQVLQALPGALLSITGTSATDVYAVGADARDGTGPMVLHYDGQTWQRLTSGVAGSLWWISVTPINGAFYMAGDQGLILRYTPATGMFQPQDTPSHRPTLFGIWGSDASHIWAVGGDVTNQDAGGVVWRFDGTTWSADTELATARPGGIPTLYKVWGRSADDVYVSGRLGGVFHFDGRQWAQVSVDSGATDPADPPLFTVHGNAAQVVATGGVSNGVIYELQGTAFEDRAPVGIPQLNGLFLQADGTGVAVGVAGTVAFRSPSGWQQQPGINTALDLHGAWIDHDGGVWAVGGDLTTDLDQGMVVYGGTAAVGSTVSQVPRLSGH
jgi:hypothetical protein